MTAQENRIRIEPLLQRPKFRPPSYLIRERLQSSERVVSAQTVDRIRECWIGEPIERYVTWLNEKNYARRSVFVRVPLLVQFGEFAQRAGATSLDDLPSYIEPFVEVLSDTAARVSI